MPRKKKENKIEVFVDGHGDVFEIPKEKAQSWRDSVKQGKPLTDQELSRIESRPVQQFEIDWNKIAANVREAAEMVKINYPRDDGPLTKNQIKQIKETAPKRGRKAK